MKIINIMGFIISIIILLYVIFTLVNLISGNTFFWFCPIRKNSGHLYITFNQFYSLYNIAPENWRIDTEDCSVCYSCPKLDKWLYIDTIKGRYKLLKFNKQLTNDKNNKINDEMMEELIKQWKLDVKKFEE